MPFCPSGYNIFISRQTECNYRIKSAGDNAPLIPDGMNNQSLGSQPFVMHAKRTIKIRQANHDTDAKQQQKNRYPAKTVFCT